MTRKRAFRDGHQDQRKQSPPAAPKTAGDVDLQRDDGYKVGPRHPPKEHQFKPGESGNPNGQPKHRTHLWTYFTQYMAMTTAERAKLDRTKLTAAQETALKMVERAIKGRGCGFEHLARYIVDREEGKAAEHIIVSDADTLSDEECEGLRQVLTERQAEKTHDGHGPE